MPILWGALLEALLSQRLPKSHRTHFEQNPMIDFVFKAPTFPRSLFFCIACCVENLNYYQNTKIHWLTQISRRRLQRYRNSDNDRAKLHKFIDSMQIALIQLNAEITARWFIQPSE